MGGITAPTGTSFAEGFTKSLSAPWHALQDLSGSASQGVFGSYGAGNAPGASWGDKIFRSYDPAAVSNATMTPAQAAAYNASGAVTTTQLPPEGFAAGPAAGGGWDPKVEFDVSGGVPGSAAPTAGLGGVQFDPVGSAPPPAGPYLAQRHLDRAATNLGPGTQVAQASGPPVAGAVPRPAAPPAAVQQSGSWTPETGQPGTFLNKGGLDPNVTDMPYGDPGLVSFGDEDTLLGGYPKPSPSGYGDPGLVSFGDEDTLLGGYPKDPSWYDEVSAKAGQAKDLLTGKTPTQGRAKPEGSENHGDART